MEAKPLADGRVRRVTTPDYGFKPPLYEMFERLIVLLSNATERLWRRRNEFPARMGIRFEEAQSLSNELLFIRYEVLGRSRPFDPSTGRYEGGADGGPKDRHRVGRIAQDRARAPA